MTWATRIRAKFREQIMSNRETAKLLKCCAFWWKTGVHNVSRIFQLSSNEVWMSLL